MNQQGHQVHYVAVETESARAQADKPPIVLIHGALVGWSVYVGVGRGSRLVL
jgi:hypothetical protein